MEDGPGPRKSPDGISLGSAKLETFFINHLNRIYFAKSHLASKLQQLSREAHFSDLKQTIETAREDVEKQLARIEMIYTLLDAPISKTSVHGIAGLVDDAFEAIEEQSGEPELRDLSIVFYLQNIESLEMASFQVLQIAAVKLKIKQVKVLLQENYDEVKQGRSLLLLIAAKYVTN